MADQFRKIVDGYGHGICCGGINCKWDRCPRGVRVRAVRIARKVLKRLWKREIDNENKISD